MTSVEDSIQEALGVPFAGWDFSWLEGRFEEVAPPWNYQDLAREATARDGIGLDIDTGGGEFLAAMAPLGCRMIATEGFGSNVMIAEKHLRPLGIHVVHTTSAPDNVNQAGTDPSEHGSCLPFAEGAFDVVLDRHSSYWPTEVRRVLRNGGRFLTQQRSDAGRTGASWPELFDRKEHPGVGFDASFAVAQLDEAGFDVLRADEADTPTTFFDLAALVYYLRAIPWAVPDLDLVKDREALERIHAAIEHGEPLVVRGSTMLLDTRAT